ncbi:GGDEF domain-containing protein [Legionella maioricensis]|uniref:diguanylate cyclase n=1 Tax=Legionella maioricensis TaxID=2896528 RepID=A0A9X2ICY3_9GAMM|nr:sensor domain-containing diguanylate cyclase [Legionella maioricensis]MCL9685671.1 diguanylate cyclase [Legionella maioricensis]MCL9689063.1 diguanylate cyclase [Legionella maioricensis]
MDFAGVPRSEIEAKLIKESYEKLPILIIGDFIASVLFALLLWNKINNPGILGVWFITMLIFNHLLRGLFLFYYHRQQRQKQLQHPRFWKNYFIINHTQSGILWALGGLLFIYIEDPFYRLLIFVYLTGLLGAPASTLLTFHLSYMGYMLPICLVMVYLALSFTAPISFILFSITLLYIAVIIFSTSETHKLLVKSIYLELYNLNLFANLKRSEESFRNTIENAPIGMAIISPEGQCIHANRTLLDLLGYSEDELRQTTMLKITHPDDLAMTKDALEKLIKGDLRISHLEKRYIRKDGQIIWMMVSASLIRDEEGKPINFITQMKDVSDRVENEEKMRQLNEKTMATLNELQLLEHDENLLNKLNRSLQICVVVEEAYPRINLIAQELFPGLSGGLSVYNKSTNQLETVIEWGEKQLLQKVFFPIDCFAIREANLNLVEDPKKEVPCSHYLNPPQGGYLALPLMVQNELIGVIHLLAPTGEKIRQHQQDMVVSFGNIVKLALANINLRASLSDLSLHDPLTSLYNRRYLNDILSRELIRIAREKSRLCVAMLDIDDFKKLNDNYSHLAGDEVLKGIGQLLKSFFRESDLAFRFGGEEFVVILLNTSLDNAVSKMEEFRERFKATSQYYKNKKLPGVTISIGVAESPQHGAFIEDILKAADHALYSAKQAGKDRVVGYVKKEQTHS